MSLHIYPLTLQLLSQNNTKFKKKTKSKPKNLVVEAKICQSESYRPFHRSSHASVCCSASMVWFEASVFCNTVNTESSLGLLLYILSFPSVMKILQFLMCRKNPFIHSSSTLMTWVLGWTGLIVS